MNILFVSAEAYPYIKTGGLGDVVGSLPEALSQPPFNHSVKILLPAYRQIKIQFDDLDLVAELGNPFGFGAMRLLQGKRGNKGACCLLLECDVLFDRDGGPYIDTAGRDHPDNAERFAALCWTGAVITQYGGLIGWQPDLVHAHDWQAGLLPAYLKAWGMRYPPVVFTIHNLQFTGAFEHAQYSRTCLPESLYHMEGLEYFGRYSMLKAGIVYSDWLTTVSPTYAREIQTPAYGCGLEGLLSNSRHKLDGILNGVDYSVWNPESDTYLAQNYDVSTASEGKTANKRALQKLLGLDPVADQPLFGVVSRLSEQKGLDLLVSCVEHLMASDAQLCLLGSGDPLLEKTFTLLAQQYPGRIATTIGYEEALSHQLQAGCDFLFVPSRFEPCGLTQLYALRYGTIPLVRRTGGLADTVSDADDTTSADQTSPSDFQAQTGIVFGDASPAALSAAIKRAITLYDDPQRMIEVRRAAMRQDFSWKTAAEDYVRLYSMLVSPDMRPER
ncbi:glycogen synthase GlgA [Allohahella marinimesophila]|uniref:Glycogen synthase n=1 Tax=Allohahella marinimesophila TaxID=1054972 RepID=A0ABP7Q9H2_9GAMM